MDVYELHQEIRMLKKALKEIAHSEEIGIQSLEDAEELAKDTLIDVAHYEFDDSYECLCENAKWDDLKDVYIARALDLERDKP